MEQKILSFSNEEQWIYDSLKQEIDVDFTPWGLAWTNVKNSDLYDRYVKWLKEKKSTEEINYMPARVLMQDFTGVPAIVDLASMRDAMKALVDSPHKINPFMSNAFCWNNYISFIFSIFVISDNDWSSFP